MKCGLLGRKLGHSYSPQIHSLLGNDNYSIFEKEPEELEAFLKTGDFTGLNVTIPYKKAVIPFLDQLSPIAQRLGAVNTIIRNADGTLTGHNTDHFGFRSMLERSGLCLAGKKVLVLGSGGASATVCAVLHDIGANVVVISRSGENHYGNLQLHADAALIVNTTPVGMYPNTGVAPLSLSQFPALKGVLDVIYNPARTQLLLDAQRRGLVTMNGLWMLVAQAKESAEWFCGESIDNHQIARIYGLLKRQMENIVLVGMPGCGKSTVAALLQEMTGKPAIDADKEIEAAAGMPIPKIFDLHGEDYFRQLEMNTLAQLGKASSTIIATGGGCVTRQDNFNALRQNSTVFWLQRDLDRLPTEGRPLSQRNSLAAMYEVRKPLYEAFSHYAVDNNGSPENTAAQILAILEDDT